MKKFVLAVLGLDRRPRADRQPAASSDANPFLPPSSATGSPEWEVRSVRSRDAAGASITKWVVRALLLVVLIAGVNQVFVKPFRSETPSGQTTAGPAAVVSDGIDPAAASAAAVAFTADYLSASPDGATARAAALRTHLAATADPAQLAWTGDGFMTADLVTAGSVTRLDSGRSVVSVQARVLVAAPVDPSAASGSDRTGSAPTTASQGRPASMPQLPAGYQWTGAQWLTVLVPVEVGASGGAVTVSGGPVFGPDAPAASATTVGEVDSAATAATREWADSFFTAYAASSTTYQTAASVELAGLSGAATLDAMPAWSVSPIDAAAGKYRGTGSVVWALQGADLSITQTYAVLLDQADSRWYAAGIGPIATQSGRTK